jgi:pimeloyl-ACP methyl ester carboxylesterase
VSSVNTADLYYEMAGSGPWLVLLHAGGMDARMWDDHMDAFTREHRVLRYDMRGHGRSSFPAGRFSHVDDLESLLRLVGVAHASFVGLSLGARVAIDFTLRSPRFIDRLVLASPSIAGYERSEELQRFSSPEDRLIEAGDVDGAIDLCIRTFVVGPGRSEEDVDHEVRRRVSEMQRIAFEKTISALAQVPVSSHVDELGLPAAARLSEVAAPTLVISGKFDVADFARNADALVAAIPNARRETIPAAHMLNLEEPRRFEELVLSFLREDPELGRRGA